LGAGGATYYSLVGSDGAGWSGLGTGIDGTPAALLAQGGLTPRLLVGGDFLSAGGVVSPGLAAWGCPACYANCDGSTAAPALNFADFSCFLQRFASGDPYANCDTSTQPPVLNVADFSCFLQRYASGCR
jgi:hypothetical protein